MSRFAFGEKITLNHLLMSKTTEPLTRCLRTRSDYDTKEPAKQLKIWGKAWLMPLMLPGNPMPISSK